MVHYLMLWALQQMDGVHYLILWGQRIGPLPNPSVMGEMNPNKKKHVDPQHLAGAAPGVKKWKQFVSLTPRGNHRKQGY